MYKRIRLLVLELIGQNSGRISKEILIIAGLLLMAISLPVASRLVSQNQDSRNLAREYECMVDKDCGTGWYCKNNVCFLNSTKKATAAPTSKSSQNEPTKKKAATTTTQPQATTCYADSMCSKGYHCGQSRTCVKDAVAPTAVPSGGSVKAYCSSSVTAACAKMTNYVCVPDTSGGGCKPKSEAAKLTPAKSSGGGTAVKPSPTKIVSKCTERRIFDCQERGLDCDPATGNCISSGAFKVLPKLVPVSTTAPTSTPTKTLAGTGKVNGCTPEQQRYCAEVMHMSCKDGVCVNLSLPTKIPTKAPTQAVVAGTAKVNGCTYEQIEKCDQRDMDCKDGACIKASTVSNIPTNKASLVAGSGATVPAAVLTDLKKGTTKCGDTKAGEVVVGAGDVIYGCDGKTGAYVNLSKLGVGPEAVTNKPSWLTTESLAWKNAVNNAKAEPTRAAIAEKIASGELKESSLLQATCAGGYGEGEVAIGNAVEGKDQVVKCKNGKWEECKLCTLTVVPEYVKSSKDLYRQYVQAPQAAQKAMEEGDLAALRNLCFQMGFMGTAECANSSIRDLAGIFFGKEDLNQIVAAYEGTLKTREVANKTAAGDKSQLEELCITQETAKAAVGIAYARQGIISGCKNSSVKDLVNKYLTGYDGSVIENSFRNADYVLTLADYVDKKQKAIEACVNQRRSANSKADVTICYKDSDSLKVLADKIKGYEDLMGQNNLSEEFKKYLSDSGIGTSFKSTNDLMAAINSDMVSDYAKNDYSDLRYNYLSGECDEILAAGVNKENTKEVVDGCNKLKDNILAKEKVIRWSGTEKDKAETEVKKIVNTEKKLEKTVAIEELKDLCRGVSSGPECTYSTQVIDLNRAILKAIYPSASETEINSMAVNYTRYQQQSLAEKQAEIEKRKRELAKIANPTVEMPSYMSNSMGPNTYSNGMDAWGVNHGIASTLSPQQEAAKKQIAVLNSQQQAIKSQDSLVNALTRTSFATQNKDKLDSSVYNSVWVEAQYDKSSSRYLRKEGLIQGGVAGALNYTGLKVTDWASGYNEVSTWTTKFNISDKQKALNEQLQSAVTIAQKTKIENSLTKLEKADEVISDIRNTNFSARGLEAGVAVVSIASAATGVGAAALPLLNAAGAAGATYIKQQADKAYHENMEILNEEGFRYNYNSQLSQSALELLDRGNSSDTVRANMMLIGQVAADGVMGFATGKMYAVAGGAGNIGVKDLLSFEGKHWVSQGVAKTLANQGVKVAYTQAVIKSLGNTTATRLMGQSAFVGTLTAFTEAADITKMTSGEWTTEDTVNLSAAAVNSVIFGLASLNPVTQKAGEAAEIYMVRANRIQTATKYLMPVAFTTNTAQAVYLNMNSGMTFGEAITEGNAATSGAMAVLSALRWKTAWSESQLLSNVDVGINAVQVPLACSGNLNSSECRMALSFLGQSYAHATRNQRFFVADNEIMNKEAELSRATTAESKNRITQELKVMRENLNMAEYAAKSGISVDRLVDNKGVARPAEEVRQMLAEKQQAPVVAERQRLVDEAARTRDNSKNNIEAEYKKRVSEPGITEAEKTQLTRERLENRAQADLDYQAAIKKIETENPLVEARAETPVVAKEAGLSEERLTEAKQAEEAANKVVADLESKKPAIWKINERRQWNQEMTTAREKSAIAIGNRKAIETQMTIAAGQQDGAKSEQAEVKPESEQKTGADAESDRSKVGGEEIVRLESEVGRLEGQLEEAVKKAEAITDQNQLPQRADADAEVERLRGELKNAQEKAVAAKGGQLASTAKTEESQRTKAEVETQSQEVARLGKEIEDLDGRIAEKQEEAKRLAGDAKQQAEQEVESLARQKDSLETQKLEKEGLIKKNEDKIAEIDNELEQMAQQEKEQKEAALQTQTTAKARSGEPRKGLAGLWDRLTNPAENQRRAKISEIDTQLTRAKSEADYVEYQKRVKALSEAKEVAQVEEAKARVDEYSQKEAVKKVGQLAEEKYKLLGNPATADIDSAYAEGVIRASQILKEATVKVTETRRANERSVQAEKKAEDRLSALKKQLKNRLVLSVENRLAVFEEKVARRSQLVGKAGAERAEYSKLGGEIRQLAEQLGVVNDPAIIRERLAADVEAVRTSVDQDPVATAKRDLGENSSLTTEIIEADKALGDRSAEMVSAQEKWNIAKANQDRAKTVLGEYQEAIQTDAGVKMQETESQGRGLLRAGSGEARKGILGTLERWVNPAERSRVAKLTELTVTISETKSRTTTNMVAVDKAVVDFDQTVRAAEERVVTEQVPAGDRQTVKDQFTRIHEADVDLVYADSDQVFLDEYRNDPDLKISVTVEDCARRILDKWNRAPAAEGEVGVDHFQSEESIAKAKGIAERLQIVSSEVAESRGKMIDSQKALAEEVEVLGKAVEERTRLTGIDDPILAQRRVELELEITTKELQVNDLEGQRKELVAQRDEARNKVAEGVDGQQIKDERVKAKELDEQIKAVDEQIRQKKEVVQLLTDELNQSADAEAKVVLAQNELTREIEEAERLANEVEQSSRRLEEAEGWEMKSGLEAEKASKEVGRMRERIAEMEKQYKELAESEGATGKAKAIREEIDSLNNELADLFQQEGEAKIALAGYQDPEVQIEGSSRQTAARRKAIAMTEDLLKSIQKNIEEHYSRIGELEGQRTALIESSSTRLQVESLSDKIAAAKESQDSLIAVESERIEALNQAKQATIAAQGAKDQAESNLAKANDPTKGSLTAARKAVEDLRRESRISRMGERQLSAERTKLETRISIEEKAGREAGTLRKQLKTVESRILDIQSAENRAVAQSDSGSSQRRNVIDIVRKALDPNGEPKRQLTKAEAELTSLQALERERGASMSQSEKDTIKQRMVEAEGKVNNLRKNVALAERKAALSNERAKLQEQIDEAKIVVTRAKTELDMVEENLMVKKAEYEKYEKGQKAPQKLLKEIQKLTEQRQKAQQKLEAAQEIESVAVAEAEKKGVRAKGPVARSGEPRKGILGWFDRTFNQAERVRIAEIEKSDEKMTEAENKVDEAGKRVDEERNKLIEEEKKAEDELLASIGKESEKRKVKSHLDSLKTTEADESYKLSEAEIEEMKNDPSLKEARSVDDLARRIMDKKKLKYSTKSDMAKAKAAAEQLMREGVVSDPRATLRQAVNDQVEAVRLRDEARQARADLVAGKSGAGETVTSPRSATRVSVSGIEKVNLELNEMQALEAVKSRNAAENARLDQLRSKYIVEVLTESDRLAVSKGEAGKAVSSSWDEVKRLGGKEGEQLAEAYDRLAIVREANRKNPGTFSEVLVEASIGEYQTALDQLRNKLKANSSGLKKLANVQKILQRIDVLNEMAINGRKMADLNLILTDLKAQLEEVKTAGDNQAETDLTGRIKETEKEITNIGDRQKSLASIKEVLIPDIPDTSGSVRDALVDIIKDTEHRLATYMGEGPRVSRQAQVDTVEKLLSGGAVAVELETAAGKTMVGGIVLKTRMELMANKTGIYLAKEGSTGVIRDQLQAMVGQGRKVTVLDATRMGDPAYVTEIMGSDYVVADAPNVDFVRNNSLDTSHPYHVDSVRVYDKLTHDIALYADEVQLTLDPRVAGINSKGDALVISASKRRAAQDMGTIALEEGIVGTDKKIHERWGQGGALVSEKKVTVVGGEQEVSVRVVGFTPEAEAAVTARMRTRNEIGGDFYDAVVKNADRIQEAVASGDPVLIEAEVKKVFNGQIPEGVDVAVQATLVLDQRSMVNTFAKVLDTEVVRKIDEKIREQNVAETGSGGRYDDPVSVPVHQGVSNDGQSFTQEMQVALEVVGAARETGDLTQVNFDGLKATEDRAYRSTAMEWLGEVRADSQNSVAAVTGTLGGNRGVVETVMGMRLFANNNSVLKMVGDVNDAANKGRIINDNNSVAASSDANALELMAELRSDGSLDMSKTIQSNGRMKVVSTVKNLNAMEIALRDSRASYARGEGEVTYFVQEGGRDFYEVKIDASGKVISRKQISVDAITARFKTNESNLRVIIDRGGATGTSIVTDVNVPGVMLTEYGESAYTIAQAGARFDRGPGEADLTVVVVGATDKTVNNLVDAKGEMNFGEWRRAMNEAELDEIRSNNTDAYDAAVQTASARPVVDLIRNTESLEVKEWASKLVVEEFGPERQGRDLSNIDGAKTTIERRNEVAQAEAKKWDRIMSEMEATSEGRAILETIKSENPEIFERMTKNRNFKGKFEYATKSSADASAEGRDSLLMAGDLEAAAKNHQATVLSESENEYVATRGFEKSEDSRVLVSPAGETDQSSGRVGGGIAPEIAAEHGQKIAETSVKSPIVKNTEVTTEMNRPLYDEVRSAEELARLYLENKGKEDGVDYFDGSVANADQIIGEARYYAGQVWQAREEGENLALGNVKVGVAMEEGEAAVGSGEGLTASTSGDEASVVDRARKAAATVVGRVGQAASDISQRLVSQGKKEEQEKISTGQEQDSGVEVQTESKQTSSLEEESGGEAERAVQAEGDKPEQTGVVARALDQVSSGWSLVARLTNPLVETANRINRGLGIETTALGRRTASVELIGRDEANGGLGGQSVSREHAYVFRDKKGNVIGILDRSSYGTMVNGYVIEAETGLSVGDEVILGSLEGVTHKLVVKRVSGKVELVSDSVFPETKGKTVKGKKTDLKVDGALGVVAELRKEDNIVKIGQYYKVMGLDWTYDSRNKSEAEVSQDLAEISTMMKKWMEAKEYGVNLLPNKGEATKAYYVRLHKAVNKNGQKVPVAEADACSDCNVPLYRARNTFIAVNEAIVSGDERGLQRALRQLSDLKKLLNTTMGESHHFRDESILSALNALIEYNRAVIYKTTASRNNALRNLNRALTEAEAKLDEANERLATASEADKIAVEQEIETRKSFINTIKMMLEDTKNIEARNSSVAESTSVFLDRVWGEITKSVGDVAGVSRENGEEVEVLTLEKEAELMIQRARTLSIGEQQVVERDEKGTPTKVKATLFRVKNNFGDNNDWGRDGNGVGSIVPMVPVYVLEGSVLRELSIKETEDYYGFEVVKDDKGEPVSTIIGVGGGRMFYQETAGTLLVREGVVVGRFSGELESGKIPGFQTGDQLWYTNRLEHKGVGTIYYDGITFVKSDKPVSQEEFEKAVEKSLEGQNEADAARTKHYYQEELEEGRGVMLGEDYYVRNGEVYTVLELKQGTLADGSIPDVGIYLGVGSFQLGIDEMPGSISYDAEAVALNQQTVMLSNGAQLNTVIVELIPLESYRDPNGGWGGHYKNAAVVRDTVGGGERMGMVDELDETTNEGVASIREVLGENFDKKDDEGISPLGVMFKNLGRNVRSLLLSKLTLRGSLMGVGKDLDALGRMADLGEYRPIAADASAETININNRTVIREWLSHGGKIQAAYSTDNDHRIYTQGGQEYLLAFLNNLFGNNKRFVNGVLLEFDESLRLGSDLMEALKANNAEEVQRIIKSGSNKNVRAALEFLAGDMDNLLGSQAGKGDWYTESYYSLLSFVINSRWNAYMSQVGGFNEGQNKRLIETWNKEAVDNYGLGEFAITIPLAKRPDIKDVKDVKSIRDIKKIKDIKDIVEPPLPIIVIPKPIPKPQPVVITTITWTQRWWTLWDGFLGNFPKVPPIVPPLIPPEPWFLPPPFWFPRTTPTGPVLPPPPVVPTGIIATPSGQPVPTFIIVDPGPTKGATSDSEDEGKCSCPKDFMCYFDASISEYRWFVKGYVMDDFKRVEEEDCLEHGVVEPNYKGKAKGDANCDGFINIWDNSVWRNEYADIAKKKSVQKEWWKADYNCDKLVNEKDYSIWKTNYKNLNSEDEIN